MYDGSGVQNQDMAPVRHSAVPGWIGMLISAESGFGNRLEELNDPPHYWILANIMPSDPPDGLGDVVAL